MRDPEASDSFTLSQLEQVFGAADGIEIRRQLDGHWVDDGQILGRTCRVLAYTGMHISVLSGGYRQKTTDGRVEFEYVGPIRSDAIRGNFLYWRRPKNAKPIAMPIKKELLPWLPEFLDAPKPTTTRRFQQMLEFLEDRVGFACNPLRFRHTCGVLLYHVLKQSASDVERLLGVTPETMLTYVVRTKEEVRRDMIEKGW